MSTCRIMAANYWESTQRKHWQFARPQLEEARQKLEDEDPGLIQTYPLPEIRHLSIYYNQLVTKLGKRLDVRQQALATAQVYIRRFYTRVEVRSTNPYLVVATAVYLACKMEECPQHIRLVVSEGRTLWPDYFSNDTSKVGECEFWMISEMNSQMIVHHPYRTTTLLAETFGLTQEESTLAWSIVNDQAMTDLALLYAPHLIGVVAVLLAIVLRAGTAYAGTVSIVSASQAALRAVSTDAESSGGAKTKVQRFAAWLSESTVDIEGMVDCIQEIISLYEMQESYNEKLTKEQINRVVKARGLDK